MSLCEAVCNRCKVSCSLEWNSCQILQNQQIILSCSSVLSSDKTTIAPVSMLVLAWWPSLPVPFFALASKSADTVSMILVKGIFRWRHLHVLKLRFENNNEKIDVANQTALFVKVRADCNLLFTRLLLYRVQIALWLFLSCSFALLPFFLERASFIRS